MAFYCVSTVTLLFSYVAAVQVFSKEPTHGKRDLVMFHVPMNFGNSIAAVGALGSNRGISYGQVTTAALRGWANVHTMAQKDAEFWGPINPDLQEISTVSNCPMYYTPPKDWPTELADRYFTNKTVFGILRDPYERLMAFYRGFHSGGSVVTGEKFISDGRLCDISSFVKELFQKDFDEWDHDPKCQLQPQAWFFEGSHGIKIPIDIRKFPESANILLTDHGYDNVHLSLDDIFHVSGCDETWAGSIDDEAKQLIKTFYAADFKLLCQKFGYCTEGENVCLTYVPGMCPHSLFHWDHKSLRYVKT